VFLGNNMLMSVEAISVKPYQSKLQALELIGILLIMFAYVGGIAFALAGNFWGMSPLERVVAAIPVLLFKIPDWIRDKLRERGGVSKFGAEYRVRKWPMEPSGWSIQKPVDLDFTDFTNFAGVVVAWVLTGIEGFDPRLVVVNGMLTAAMFMIYIPKPRSVPFALATDGEKVHLVAWMIEADFPLRDLRLAKLRVTTYTQSGYADVKIELWIGASDEAINLDCERVEGSAVGDLDRLLSGWFEQRTLNG
jgi:hypothetical protein